MAKMSFFIFLALSFAAASAQQMRREAPSMKSATNTALKTTAIRKTKVQTNFHANKKAKAKTSMVLDHKASLVEKSDETRTTLASYLTNRGTLTLQGLPTGGPSMTCNVPQCSRADGCQGAECCNTQMFEAVSAISDWMKSNDVDYTLLFGTLLGAYRDNDVIPWTGDVDIGIYSKDVAKLIGQTDIPWQFGYKNTFEIPRGCENHHPGFPGAYSKFTMDQPPWRLPSTQCSYYIDLYVLDEPYHGGNIAKSCIAKSLGPDGRVKTSTVEIRGKTFTAPLQIEDCLVAKYGPNWKTPDASEAFHG